MRNNLLIPVYDLTECHQQEEPLKGFSIARYRSKGYIAELQRPHRHAGYSIMLILSGKLTHYIDFQQYTVVAPALMFLSPDLVHQHGAEADFESITIAFDKEFLMTEAQHMVMCWECMFNHSVLEVTEQQLKEMLVFTQVIQQEYRKNGILREPIIRSVLNAMIMASSRIPSQDTAFMQTDNVQSRMVRQFKELSDVHFRDKTQVAHYADMMYVTPGHLNDTIKSTIGRSPKQIIDEKRVMEAKRLLFWGEHTVKEIAYQLNFEDDAYFNRFFKKHTGHTPALFQKTIREKYN